MTSPISHISSRIIGTVESVAPDEIKVLLDVDSPRNTALNTGVPTPFPRINSFVLLPNETGAVVGTIVWLGVERSAYPKRQGLKDFGLIDLPFPLRKMAVVPIGTLTAKQKGKQEEEWVLRRGVQSFPSVGDNVMPPTREQTIAIVTGQGKDSRVELGTCPSAHDAKIAVDPDKLFGRHLAVLGNTGSGKSCTLAALVRSSIESAQKEAIKSKGKDAKPNARFIILDPNGEYAKCFKNLKCRVFQVPPLSNDKEGKFVLPAWMWNSSEWAAVVQASSKIQRPLLQEALRNLKSGQFVTSTPENRLFVKCETLKRHLRPFSAAGVIGSKYSNEYGNAISRFCEDTSIYTPGFSADHKENVKIIIKDINKVLSSRMWTSGKRIGFNQFGEKDLIEVIKKIDEIIQLLSVSSETEIITEIISEDAPLPFDLTMLAEHLEFLAMLKGGNSDQFIATMLMRIKTMLSDARMKAVINPEKSPCLAEWLRDNIGADGAKNGPVTIIDLSLIPHEILHLVIAVASRLIFESLQRYRKKTNRNLPTVLVLEEAHTFVAKRLRSNADEIPSPADMCRSAFEKIAREGRKFGLGLVLSSQRPSELSETVLSQCNSFLLHRITNDRDQELVSQLVPDTTRGLLKELPSLPTRHCILLGMASKIPVLIEVTNLEKGQRPQSEDPDFWDVWTCKSGRGIDWDSIVGDWTGKKLPKDSDTRSSEKSS